jgi:hypothetical protein
MERMTQPTTHFSDRVRFNWGYHDGALDARRGKPNRWGTESHYDAAYSDGYAAGFARADAGEPAGNSDHAWEGRHGARAA